MQHVASVFTPKSMAQIRCVPVSSCSFSSAKSSLTLNENLSSHVCPLFVRVGALDILYCVPSLLMYFVS